MGVAVLLLVGYLHLMDISHKVEEGVWYMAFAFASLILLTVALGVALVRSDASSVRFVWVGAAGLAAAAMFGYFVSRAIPLPGMADHQGDWFNALGIVCGLVEIGLVGLAGFALRDRVRRTAGERTRIRRPSPLASPAVAMFALMIMQPSLALAHGGEEMSDEEMAAMDDSHAGMDMGGDMSNMAHGDPLLGTTELGLAFLLAASFLAWAGVALRTRVLAAKPTRPRRARPSLAPIR